MIYLLDVQLSFDLVRIDVYVSDQGLNLYKLKNLWFDKLNPCMYWTLNQDFPTYYFGTLLALTVLQVILEE